MAADMTQRTLFFIGWLCLTLTAGPALAQQDESVLAATLSRAYTTWRDAMIQKNPQAWAGAITTYRQTMIRNEIVNNKEGFPAAVFAAPGEPPSTDGMRLVEAQAVGTTAHLVYFGKIDGGKDAADANEVLMKLKFGLEGGRWRYDSARVTDLDSSPEVLKALREGKKPDLLDAPEFTPPGKMPPAPPLCRVPDFKGGLKLQSTGYETQVLMNGFSYDPVENGLDQQLVLGGLVAGQNEVTLRLRPVTPPDGQKPVVRIRLYKIDLTKPEQPAIEVLRWESPATGAPKEVTLPFIVR